MRPRPYQRPCLAALRRSRSAGKSRALVVMATGLGKTAVAAFDVRDFLKDHPDARVLYISHQNDINRQARKTFEEVLGPEYIYGYFHGNERHLHKVTVLFASFQLMAKQRQQFRADEFDYIVVDESN